MNSLQPLKQEYRQIAELELLAQKDYKAYKAEENNYQVQLKKVKSQTIDNSFKSLSPVKDQQNDDDFKWDKLLAEIDNIQVSWAWLWLWTLWWLRGQFSCFFNSI